MMIGGLLKNSDYPATPAAGLTIMSILADCCAGNTKCRVTDENAAYAAIGSFLQGECAPTPATDPVVAEALVPIRIKMIDLETLELRRLIDFRKRERDNHDHAIRDLRHRYIDKIAAHSKELAEKGARPGDRLELEKQFEQDMEADLQSLKEELRVAATAVWTSKEMLTAILATAATIGTVAAFPLGALAPNLGAAAIPLTIGGLVGARNSYLATRKSVMQKHPMAYIYEFKKG